MGLDDILCDLKPQGRESLVNDINEIHYMADRFLSLDRHVFIKDESINLCRKYNLTPTQLGDVTKTINNSADKDERVLRRYMLELKYGGFI